MFRSKRLRFVAAVVLAIGATGLVAIASGGAEPSVVRLHLGSDSRKFQFGTTTQTLTTTNNSCAISSAEPLVDLAATGTQASPGLGSDSIGVKSKSGANGTPCGQTDAAEGLQLKPGTSITNRTFSGVRLDLEVTGNATVKLTLSRGATSAVYLLQTGGSIAAAQSSEPDYDRSAPYFVSSSPGDATDACAAPNSSGPNSGSNDNCQWTAQPGFAFDTVNLTTVSAGTVALEGSNDFGNDPTYDTLFYLSNSPPTPTNDTVTTNEDTAASGNVLTNDTDPDGNPLTASVVTNPTHGAVSLTATGAFTYTPAANYNGADSFTYAASDGSASTNATVTVTVFPVICSNETVSDADGSVVGSFTRLDDSFRCKRYALDASAGTESILFQPSGAANVDYRGFVSFGPGPAPTPDDPVELALDYDPTGGNTFQPVQWCVGPQFDADDHVTTATIPAGETWCIASADTRGNADGDLVTTYQVFGHDDPKFGRR